jgi:hypothetical protein
MANVIMHEIHSWDMLRQVWKIYRTACLLLKSMPPRSQHLKSLQTQSKINLHIMKEVNIRSMMRQHM